MTFSNPLYSAVTSKFFDFLATTMHTCFQDRCRELYYSENSTQPVLVPDGDKCEQQNMIDNYIEDK
mgnify:CR=1 FL=1